MLQLNLVSQELKRDIRLRHIYELLKRANFILIVITVFVAVVILVAKVILQNNFNKIVEQTTLITRNSQSYNLKAKEINERINYVHEIQNDFTTWSSVINEISQAISDEVALNLLKIDKGNEKMMLRGVARTRDGLLEFKEGLEKSNIFYEVDFPLKNILEKENIIFEINTEINLDEI